MIKNSKYLTLIDCDKRYKDHSNMFVLSLSSLPSSYIIQKFADFGHIFFVLSMSMRIRIQLLFHEILKSNFMYSLHLVYR